MSGPRLRMLRTSVPLLLAITVALAQSAPLAPTGTHYAGRPTDTGFAAVSNLGGYRTAVDLDLPAARGGVPLPLSLAYDGSRRVGAAGIGWDVPLSFVRLDTSFAHRRPAFGAQQIATGREQVLVSIAGTTTPMIRGGLDTSGKPYWVVRDDGPTWILTQESSDTWRLRDGNAQEFEFSKNVDSNGSEMMPDDIWMLSSIRSPSNVVTLTYDVSSRGLLGTGVQCASGQAGTPCAVEIDLTKISYNQHPTTGSCWKNDITLEYGTNRTEPYSHYFFGSVSMVRSHMLAAITVRAREACGQAAVQLHRYDLAYDEDPDTHNPRLRSVWLKGKTGSLKVPLGSYEYASAAASGTLDFSSSYTVDVPADARSATNGTHIAGTDDSESWRDLIDFTGDGRPDLVFPKNGALWIAVNLSSGAHPFDGKVRFDTPVQLTNNIFTSRALSSSSHYTLSYDPYYVPPHPPGFPPPIPDPPKYDPFNSRYTDETWRQVIDVNGDGRLDVIDSREQTNTWTVYLNTPGTPVTWVKRSIDVSQVRSVLEAAGYVIDGDYLPLQRRGTGWDTMQEECWQWDRDASPHRWTIASDPSHCHLVEGLEKSGELTVTEWTLKDINGDGLPDFTYLGAPVSNHFDPPPPPTDECPDCIDGSYKVFKPLRAFKSPAGPHAMFNAAGVRIHQQNVFSAALPLAGGTCIDMWREDKDGTLGVGIGRSEHVCELTDVNGDGLIDFRISNIAYLGSGKGFSDTNIEMELPGRTHTMVLGTTCPAGDSQTLTQGQGLHDITGDGIPDFIEEVRSNGTYVSRVWVGTGHGFMSPIFTTDRLVLSSTVDVCDGNKSHTSAGLYDLDGDGRPEQVKMLQTPEAWQVSRLPGVSNTGLMTALDNGFGARTEISYTSAKDDLTTEHSVPFPEIVVSSVETKGTRGLGGSLHIVRYAYGNAKQFFDPGADAFVFRGYGRSLAVYGVGSKANTAALAVFSDSHTLDPYDPAVHNTELKSHARYQRVGRAKDAYTLAGDVPADPWTFLSSNPSSSTMLIGGEHTDWNAQQVPSTALVDNREDCADVMYPYDWYTTWNINNANGTYACILRAVTYARATTAWVGTAAPLVNYNNLESRVETTAVDSYGRARSILDLKDTSRTDDDLCVDVTYADFTTDARMMSAVATRTIWDCKNTTSGILRTESFEYDNLPVGKVGAGFLTSRTVERHATDNGENLGRIREFAASYDSLGNPTYVVSARSDGATRSIETTYDPFRLAALTITVAATGLDKTITTIARDPLTLTAVGGTDPNGSSWTSTSDDLERPTSVSVSPPSGSPVLGGLVSTSKYLGFDGSGTERQVVTTTYVDPVPQGGSGVPHTRAVRLDELGRVYRVESDLGTSYGGESLVVDRTYDEIGRVKFESDPHPASQTGPSYGTTYHFGSDGQLRCSIRGTGTQPLTLTSVPASEIFPTCIDRLFANHQLTVISTSPDATVPNTQQTGVKHSETMTAAGRVISRETTKSGTRLELTTHTFDRLGQLVDLTRYQAPATAAQPVSWTFRLDSAGQTLQVTEPAVAPRTFTYSDFGELVSVEWKDSTSGTTIPKKITHEYDALGRLSRSYESEKGTVLADTYYEWIYDKVDPSSPMAASYAAGRLTATKSAIGKTYISYDAFGHVARRAFVAPSGEAYFEDVSTHFDGSLALLEHRLPDSGYAKERYEYTYDSAGQLSAIRDVETGSSLYQADAIDPLGRVLKAHYNDGKIAVDREFATTGRRLAKSDSTVDAAGNKRLFTFDAYDALGREVARNEYKNGAQQTFTNGYDALGQLGSQRVDVPNQSPKYRAFNYDALGNILELTNSTGGSAYLTFDSLDKDRLCRISYGSASTGACNVSHDGLGNITKQPTRTGTRSLDYFPGGAVRKISEGSNTASFRYDGTGQLSELILSGPIPVDPREDRRFGPFTRRKLKTGTVIVRDIPGVGSRRGKNGPIVFPFGEARGLRFSAATGEDKFVQDVAYLPYGESSSEGAKPGEVLYSNDQWNDGDLLADLGLSYLGARLYDPVIGRFLSRDPLLIPRSASETNPYAYSYNDPINFSDPTGLCGEAGQNPCADPLVIGGDASGSGSGRPQAPAPKPERPAVVSSPTGPVPGSASPSTVLATNVAITMGTLAAAYTDNGDSTAWIRVQGAMSFAGGLGLMAGSFALTGGSLAACFAGPLGCAIGVAGMLIGADVGGGGILEAVTAQRQRTLGGMIHPTVQVWEESTVVAFGVSTLLRSSIGSLRRPLPSTTTRGTLIPNKFSPKERAFAEEILERESGLIEGPPTRSFPGIDGYINGAPLSLKETGGGLGAVLKYASEAEKKALAYGYEGVQVYIKAENVSSARLLDFANKGPLVKIPTQGTVSKVTVKTADGWVTFGGE